MKKFISKIAVYLLLTFLILTVLDFAYTTIYSKSVVRNSIQYMLNAPPKHYDVIVLGSSRAANHIVPAVFKDQGIVAYNFGMSGSGLSENALFLKLFFEKGNTTDKILLQVDLNFEKEASSEGNRASFLPFLSDSETIYNHLLNNNADSDCKSMFVYRYIPFFRFMKLDAKIGFREFFLTSLKRGSNSVETEGFMPLVGVLNSKEAVLLPKVSNKANKYYDEIKQISKAKKVLLIAFEAPFCKYVTNGDYFAKLKTNVPELYDYSGVVTADSLFSSCGHMNEKGARVFTKFILKRHFKI